MLMYTFIVIAQLHSETPQLHSCNDTIWCLPTTSFIPGKTLGSSVCCCKDCLPTCFVDSACQCHCLSKAERPPSATVQTQTIFTKRLVTTLRPGVVCDWRAEKLKNAHRWTDTF